MTRLTVAITASLASVVAAGCVPPPPPVAVPSVAWAEAGARAVKDYDEPPRPLQQPRPQYPPRAFAKKLEGTVDVEIFINEGGHVTSWKVTKSIPALDAAAVACVSQWLFTPAKRHGQPVPSLAVAPVTFRIY